MNDDSSGVGIFSPELNLRIRHRFPTETTIFTAEAWAILQTINIIDSNCTKAVIFSDSKRILDSLTSSSLNNKNYLIYNIKNKLLNVQREGRKVILF